MRKRKKGKQNVRWLHAKNYRKIPMKLRTCTAVK